MRRFEVQDVVVQREVEVGRCCDGCGVAEDDAEFGLHDVVIMVDEGGEGGGVDELDFCNDCLLERAPAFVAAGSTAGLVTGLPQGPVLEPGARQLLTSRLLELQHRWGCTREGGPYADAIEALLAEVAGG